MVSPMVITYVDVFVVVAAALQDQDEERSYTDEQGYWQEIWSPDYDKREVSVYGSGSESD